MCVLNDAKSRKLYSFAAACLALGLLLPMSFHPVTEFNRNLLHFVCGLLIGMSLSINLGMVWRSSRQRRTESGSGL
jgi:hypothetical protein